MEENQIHEAVVAEARETSLRRALSQSEKQLASLQESIASAEEQIRCAYKERDAACEAYRACQIEFISLRNNYSNLQKVLENLEKGIYGESKLAI